MFRYYTSITELSWLALCVLCILVWENDRLSPRDKRQLYLTYAAVAFSSLAEWLGVRLNGFEEVPAWVLRVVKCADYILTPLVGGALAAQLRTHSIYKKLILGTLAANTLLQLISVFTGWMITIDAHHYYTHGPLYIVYVGLYLLLIALVIADFTAYGRRFRRQNRRSLFAILLLVVVGIMMQELLGSEIRTSYITLTIGMALMFIHYAEFSQLAADDAIQEQRILITTDALTGLYSRHAYARALTDLDVQEHLPEGLAAFSIDVNGLKAANDTLGHEAGDELICAAADCISSSFGSQGTCFRTGGDEFVVLSEMDRAQAEEAIARLNANAAAWRGEKVDRLHLAAGYALASDHPALSAEKLIQKADMEMYAAKAEYYSQSGAEQRSTQ